MTSTGRRLIIASIPLLVGGAALLFVHPIAQPASFHDFADRRTIFGIANFMDVISNAPFLAIGSRMLRRLQAVDLPADLRLAFAALALTLIGTSFGSSYYHLSPSTPTLVYDRIPLSMLFAAIFAVIVRARTRRAFPPFALAAVLACAAASVLWWAHTERLGKGDLRWYGLVQFGGMAAIVLVIGLFRKEAGSARPFIAALLLYAIALVLQEFDRPIFDALGGKIGGHALKHLFAAAATVCFVRVLDRPATLFDGGDAAGITESSRAR